MPKTYNSLTVANAAAGSAILASDHAKAFENINNYRVPPMCSVRLTSSISPYTTGAAIAWNSAAIDTDGMWSSGAATRLTAQTAGIYSVVFQGRTVQASGSVLTLAAPQIAVDGGQATQTYCRALSSGGCLFNVSAILSLTAGQYVTLSVEHEGGTTYTLDGGASLFRANCRAEMVWLGQVS